MILTEFFDHVDDTHIKIVYDKHERCLVEKENAGKDPERFLEVIAEDPRDKNFPYLKIGPKNLYVWNYNFLSQKLYRDTVYQKLALLEISVEEFTAACTDLMFAATGDRTFFSLLHSMKYEILYGEQAPFTAFSMKASGMLQLVTTLSVFPKDAQFYENRRKLMVAAKQAFDFIMDAAMGKTS